MKNKLNDFLCALTFVLIAAFLLVAVFVFKPKNIQVEEATDTIKHKPEDNVYNVLLLGRDNTAGLCDVIILGSINTDSGDIMFMQIPRDTYFNCSVANYKKMNGAYNSLGGASTVADVLSNSLGIDIDYYLSLKLDAVEKIVNAVGGIDVDIPMDMEYSDPTQNLYIQFKAGNQTLNGEQAVEFVRYRSGYVTGDLGRIDAQKLFLNAFAKKVAEMANPFTFYNLFKIVCDNGETNITANDFASLGIKCMQAKTGKVSYLTAPGEAIQSTQSGAWYYILSAPSMNEILDARFDSKEKFDKENKFVDSNNEAFCDIYNKSYEIKIYTKDDIENNKININ